MRMPRIPKGEEPFGEGLGAEPPIAPQVQGFDQPGHYASRSVTPRSKCDLYTSLNEVQTCARDNRRGRGRVICIYTNP